MYTQVFDPVSDSLALSSIFAALPLVVLFVLIGVVRMAAQWAAMIGLAVALLVAIVIYDMPVTAVGTAAAFLVRRSRTAISRGPRWRSGR